jgi:hypothetical protein
MPPMRLATQTASAPSKPISTTISTRKEETALATNTKTLRMVFRNEAGKNVTISLDSPRADVTPAEIEAAMDLVIARNIFTSSGGDLVSKQDIRIIDSTTNDLYDPA